MKIIFSCLLIGFCLSSCNSDTTAKKQLINNDTATIERNINYATNSDTTGHLVADSTAHISLDKKDPAKIISGKLKGNGESIKIYIDVKAGESLHMFIEPEEQNANIRLNQIIYPGGRSEGPFSRDQKFVLKNTGQYQLIIGNNLMAEGKTKIAFNLHLSIQ